MASKYKYAVFLNFIVKAIFTMHEKDIVNVNSTSFYVKMQVFNGVLSARVLYNLH